MSNIRLRPLEPSDLEYIYKWENEPELWLYSDSTAPLSRHLIASYLKDYDLDVFRTGQLRLMIETKDTNKQVGIIDLYEVSAVHARAMVGIFVEPLYRQHNYSSEALAMLANYASNKLGLHQLAAHILEDNIPARKTFEKAGYTQTASLKDWQRTPFGFKNILLYQKKL